MSLIDLFKGFHERSVLKEYPPSARVLYFVLLGEVPKKTECSKTPEKAARQRSRMP